MQVFRPFPCCQLIPLFSLLLGDLEAQTRESANFTTSEDSGHRVVTTAGIHENSNREDATKSKVKVFILYFSLNCNCELKQNSNYSNYYCLNTAKFGLSYKLTAFYMDHLNPSRCPCFLG